MNRLIIGMLLAISLSACAPPKKPTPPPPFDMSWMEIDTTQRSEVIDQLGKPASYLEDGKVVFYRLVNERVSQSINIASTRDSIVLIFDDEGLLKSKKRVKR